MSVMNGGGSKMAFRQSNALASIQAFQAGGGGGGSMKRASVAFSMGGESGSEELRIENERLKTTLMILNQKMKMQEDSEDMSDKWKS